MGLWRISQSVTRLRDLLLKSRSGVVANYPRLRCTGQHGTEAASYALNRWARVFTRGGFSAVQSFLAGGCGLRLTFGEVDGLGLQPVRN